MLGYRSGKISGDYHPEWVDHDEEFFRDLVDILQPEFIFCLGRSTFSGVLRALSVPCPSIEAYNAFIRSNENPVSAQLRSGQTVKVCALAHCGSLGTMNRNRKIKNAPDHHPQRKTALQLAIALRLNLDQTRDLIGKAGYALTDSNRADLILTYCIQNEEYDIDTIDALLVDLGEKALFTCK